ncbi:MAG: TIGR02996 domain-containing protein [Geodermatophilaceae bacterium]|nr:TIGR02996 domain-containing protein [Geodermatophilaceae bacterium]
MSAELLRNPDLEAAILEAPLDLAPRMVYGDWLAAQGDPRGPWFALSAAVEAAPLDVRLRSAATELFHANGRLFLGQGVGLRPNAWFGWLGGFLDEVRLHPFATLARAARAAKALFAHPHARFLRHVSLGNLEHLEEIVETLATEDLPLLESLTAIDSDETSAVGQIDIDRVLAPGARFTTTRSPCASSWQRRRMSMTRSSTSSSCGRCTRNGTGSRPIRT